jgi:hypothetical protein
MLLVLTGLQAPVGGGFVWGGARTLNISNKCEAIVAAHEWVIYLSEGR